MKILVVGAKGFIAKNLVATLENIISGKDKSYHIPEDMVLYLYSREMGKEALRKFCRDCGFVFYLAGVNRPVNPHEYMEGNVELLKFILDGLRSYNNRCPIMYASSVQADMDNEYGRSKKEGERLLLEYSKKAGVPVYVYRLANVFGKWSRPNYNSAVATFCYNLARDLPIWVDDPEKEITLVYIDDVVRELVELLRANNIKDIKNPLTMRRTYTVRLNRIVGLIEEFKISRGNKQISNMVPESFEQRLYSTYLSFLPEDKLKHPYAMNNDQRGSFTELFRTNERGQISVIITRPGITRGEHWHHTKNEKFVVVSGSGLIRLRRIDSSQVWDFPVSGKKIEAVDIPPGYTHSIKNIGSDDLVTIVWANENFEEERPDTYFMKVEEGGKQ